MTHTTKMSTPNTLGRMRYIELLQGGITTWQEAMKQQRFHQVQGKLHSPRRLQGQRVDSSETQPKSSQGAPVC